MLILGFVFIVCYWIIVMTWCMVGLLFNVSHRAEMALGNFVLIVGTSCAVIGLALLLLSLATGDR